ncbi:MAG: hypothetical protein ACD_60C00024G0010 [uncultured bacterium]|nr:MAG: hypothetical protein ACD_60C00024G0010 [uncultured bacterium]
MILKQEISSLASTLQLPPTTVEKDYVLSCSGSYTLSA